MPQGRRGDEEDHRRHRHVVLHGEDARPAVDLAVGDNRHGHPGRTHQREQHPPPGGLEVRPQDQEDPGEGHQRRHPGRQARPLAEYDHRQDRGDHRLSEGDRRRLGQRHQPDREEHPDRRQADRHAPHPLQAVGRQAQGMQALAASQHDREQQGARNVTRRRHRRRRPLAGHPLDDRIADGESAEAGQRIKQAGPVRLLHQCARLLVAAGPLRVPRAARQPVARDRAATFTTR